MRLPKKKKKKSKSKSKIKNKKKPQSCTLQLLQQEKQDKKILAYTTYCSVLGGICFPKSLLWKYLQYSWGEPSSLYLWRRETAADQAGTWSHQLSHQLLLLTWTCLSQAWAGLAGRFYPSGSARQAGIYPHDQETGNGEKAGALSMLLSF